MKRAAPWEKSSDISSDDSSGSDSEDGTPRKKTPTKDGGPQSKDHMSKGLSSRGGKMVPFVEGFVVDYFY